MIQQGFSVEMYEYMAKIYLGKNNSGSFFLWVEYFVFGKEGSPVASYTVQFVSI